MPVALADRLVVKGGAADVIAERRRGGRVMITVTDVTQRIAAAKALVAAKKQAESVNAAKSRLLAAEAAGPGGPARRHAWRDVGDAGHVARR